VLHPFANPLVLTNNNGSVLRSIGPVMGATVPTLHVGMLFSASCWYRDPHGLPWIEYLHTGAEKIWLDSMATYCAVTEIIIT
jgi:protein Jumonji